MQKHNNIYNICSLISYKRLDQYLTYNILQNKYSRKIVQKCIEKGNVLVNNIQIKKKNYFVKFMDNICITFYIENKINKIKKISLDIVYEDQYIIIINKKANILVHPTGSSNENHNTLLNAILYYYKYSINIPRSGIVHRLDKDTTGLLMVAKTLEMYYHLKTQIKERKIEKKYYALVNGNVLIDGFIECYIKRNKKRFNKMAVHHSHGKYSLTTYKILKKFKKYTLLDITIITGRTHQIRLHMNYINHSILCDKLYNRNEILDKKINNILSRQALHAYSITFTYPEIYKKKSKNITIPLAKDIKNAIDYISRN